MTAGRPERAVDVATPRPPVALTIVLVHVALVAVFGAAYSKVRVPVIDQPIYVTEVAVLLATVFGASAIGNVPRDAITKLVLGFLGVGAVWVLIAGVGDPAGAGAKALSFFVYAVFYFVVRGGASTDELRWRFLRVVTLAIVIATVLTLIRSQSGVPVETTTGSGRWEGGNFALIASIAAMVVVPTAIVRGQVSTWGAVVLLAVAIELVLVQHRSGFVALGVALLATALFLLGSARALRGLMKLAGLGFLAVVLAQYALGVHLDDTFARIASIGDTTDANIDWRLLAWYEVADGITQRPFGHGFATWEFVFTTLDPLTGSHNSFLDLAYRVGLPGLALLIACVVVLIARTRRWVQLDGPQPHLVAIACCGGLIAFVTFATFNVVLSTPYMSVLFWVLLGLGAGALPTASAPPAPARPST